ncbi:MAG: hypothetical protein WC658_00575, partial [Candidatus Omnitrophota bacterium]
TPEAVAAFNELTGNALPASGILNADQLYQLFTLIFKADGTKQGYASDPAKTSTFLVTALNFKNMIIRRNLQSSFEIIYGNAFDFIKPRVENLAILGDLLFDKNGNLLSDDAIEKMIASYPFVAGLINALKTESVSIQLFLDWTKGKPFAIDSLPPGFDLSPASAAIYGRENLKHFASALFTLGYYMDFLLKEFKEHHLNIRDFNTIYKTSLGSDFALNNDFGLAAVLFMIISDNDSTPAGFKVEFDVERYVRTVPHVASLINLLRGNGDFVSAINRFHGIGFTHSGDFSLNPRLVGDQFDLRRAGRFLFTIGSEIDSGVYQDARAYMEMMVKIDKSWNELEKRAGHAITIDPDKISFEYRVMAGVVTIFVHDGYNFKTAYINPYAISKYAITFVADGRDLLSLSHRYNQEADLLKDAVNVLSIAERESMNYRDMEVAQRVQYFYPNGEKFVSSLQVYDSNPATGYLLRETVADREHNYQLTTEYDYIGRRWLIAGPRQIPVYVAGRAITYVEAEGTRRVLSETENQSVDIAGAKIQQQITYYGANGKEARSVARTVGLLGGNTQVERIGSVENGQFTEDKYTEYKYKDAFHETLKLSHEAATYDWKGELLSRSKLLSARNAMLEVEETDFVNEVVRRKQMDIFDKTYRNELYIGGSNVLYRITENEFKAAMLAGFGVASRGVTIEPVSRITISESMPVALDEGAFNEFGGASILHLDRIHNTRRIVMLNGRGQIAKEFLGEETNYAQSSIQSDVAISYAYDDRYWRSREVASRAERYVWDNQIQANGALISFTVPQDFETVATSFGSYKAIRVLQHKEVVETETTLYFGLATANLVRIVAGQRISDINFNSLGVETESITTNLSGKIIETSRSALDSRGLPANTVPGIIIPAEIIEHMKTGHIIKVVTNPNTGVVRYLISNANTGYDEHEGVVADVLGSNVMWWTQVHFNQRELEESSRTSVFEGGLNRGVARETKTLEIVPGKIYKEETNLATGFVSSYEQDALSGLSDNIRRTVNIAGRPVWVTKVARDDLENETSRKTTTESGLFVSEVNVVTRDADSRKVTVAYRQATGEAGIQVFDAATGLALTITRDVFIPGAGENTWQAKVTYDLFGRVIDRVTTNRQGEVINSAETAPGGYDRAAQTVRSRYVNASGEKGEMLVDVQSGLTKEIIRPVNLEGVSTAWTENIDYREQGVEAGRLVKNTAGEFVAESKIIAVDALGKRVVGAFRRATGETGRQITDVQSGLTLSIERDVDLPGSGKNTWTTVFSYDNQAREAVSETKNALGEIIANAAVINYADGKAYNSYRMASSEEGRRVVDINSGLTIEIARDVDLPDAGRNTWTAAVRYDAQGREASRETRNANSEFVSSAVVNKFDNGKVYSTYKTAGGEEGKNVIDVQSGLTRQMIWDLDLPGAGKTIWIANLSYDTKGIEESRATVNDEGEGKVVSSSRRLSIDAANKAITSEYFIAAGKARGINIVDLQSGLVVVATDTKENVRHENLYDAQGVTFGSDNYEAQSRQPISKTRYTGERITRDVNGSKRDALVVGEYRWINSNDLPVIMGQELLRMIALERGMPVEMFRVVANPFTQKPGIASLLERNKVGEETGSQTYLLKTDNQNDYALSRKIAYASKEDAVAYNLSHWQNVLAAQGLNALSRDLSDAEIFTVHLLAPDESTVSRSWQVITKYGEDRELGSIDPGKGSITFNVYNPFLRTPLNKGMVGALSMTLDDGELLNVSYVLDDRAEVSKDGHSLKAKRILALDRVTKRAFVEYRNINGTFEEKEDVEYAGSFAKETLVDALHTLSRVPVGPRLATGDIARNVAVVAVERAYYDGNNDYSEDYLRFINVPAAAKSFMQGRLIGESALERILFERGNFRTVSLKDEIFTTESGEQLSYAVRVVRNGLGLVLEEWFGHKDAEGSFAMKPGDIRVFRFYNGLAKYGIAQNTVTTIVNAEGQEEPFTFANITKILGNGDVTYSIQQGFSDFRLPNTGYNNDNQRLVADMLNDRQVNSGKGIFDWVYREWDECKDNRGRLLSINEEGYIAFIKYTDLLGAYPESSYALRGIGKGSRTYEFNLTDDQANYAGLVPLAVVHNPKFYQDNYSGGRWLLRYDVNDRRYGETLKNKGYSISDGRIAFDEYVGKPGQPEKIRLYYSSREIPSHAIGIDKNGGAEIWRNYRMALINKNNHRYIVIDEVDPVREEYWGRYAMHRFVYPELGWTVIRDGKFFASTEKWNYSTEKYKGAKDFGEVVRNNLISRIFGLHKEAVKESRQVKQAVLDKGKFISASTANDQEVEHAQKTRLERWSNGNFLGVLLPLLSYASLIAGLWWIVGRFITRRKVFNLNSVEAEALEMFFSRRDSQAIVLYRRRNKVIKIVDEIKGLLKDMSQRQFNNVKKHLRVNEVAPSGKSAASANIVALRTVASLSNATIDANPILVSIKVYLIDLIQQGFLSEQQALGIIKVVANALEPDTMSDELCAAKLLRELFRAAYWDNDGFLRDNVKDALRAAIEKLYADSGVPVFDTYIDNIIQEMTVIRPEEFVFPNPVNFEGGVSLDTHLWFFNQTGKWTPVAFEDYVLGTKLIYQMIPFLALETPVVRFILREVKDVLTGKITGITVNALLDAYNVFFKQVLDDQVKDKMPEMRDILSGGNNYEKKDSKHGKKDSKQWKFLLIPEELNDLFWYMMGETSYGQLDAKIVASKEYQDGKATIEKEIVAELRLGGGKYKGKALTKDEIQDIVEKIFKPFILGVREELGIPRYDFAKGRWGFWWWIIRHYLLDKHFRFWNGKNADVNKVKTARAEIFWIAVKAAWFGFILYIVAHIALNWIFIPIPFALKFFGFSFVLPMWTKWLVLLIAWLPVPGIFRLTFPGLQFVAKMFLRRHLHYKYNLSYANTYAKAVALLPELLKDDEFRAKFKKTITVLHARINLTTKEFSAFNELIAAVQAGDMVRIFKLVTQLSILRVKKEENYLKNFINKQFRRDMAPEPQTIDELRSVMFLATALGDPSYSFFAELNKVEGLQTKLGMLAWSGNLRSEFEVLIERMVELGLINADQKEELELLMAKPNYVLKEFDSSSAAPAREFVEEWANIRILGGYSNMRTAADCRDIVYDHYLNKFLPGAANQARREELKDALVHLVFSNDKDGVVLERFIREVTGDQTLDLYKFLEDLRFGREEARFNEIKAEVQKNPSKKYSVDLKGVFRMGEREVGKLFLYLVLARTHNVIISKGRFVNGNESTIGDEKYTSWKANASLMRTEIMLGMDIDHAFPIEELWAVPCIGVQYSLSPRLAIAPYNAFISNAPLSSVASSMAIMEEGWIHGEQLTKDEVDQVLFYGKGALRIAALRNCIGAPQEYVAEDAVTAMNMASAGLSTSTLNYFATEKGMPNSYRGAMVPLKKWSGDAPETVVGVNSVRYFYSPYIPWYKKLGTLETFDFYLKKPSVLRTTELMIIIFYVLDLNFWVGLAFALFINSVIIAQAISYAGYAVFAERYSGRRGAWMFFKLMFKFLFAFCTSLIVQYADAVDRGYDKFAKFIRTAARSGPQGREEIIVDLYIFLNYGIKRGVILGLLVIGSSFDPVKAALWAFPILTVIVGWWFGPFLFNPVIAWSVNWKLHLKQRFENIVLHPLYVMCFGVFDFTVDVIRRIGIPFVPSLQLGAWERKHIDLPIYKMALAFKELDLLNKGIHYALKGYIKGEGRIKGYPSATQLVVLWWRSRKLAAAAAPAPAAAVVPPVIPTVAPATPAAPAVPAAPAAPAASPSLWQKAGRALGKLFKGKAPLFLLGTLPFLTTGFTNNPGIDSTPIGEIILIGLAVLVGGVTLFFLVWRVFFPVQWFNWRLKSSNLRTEINAARKLIQLGDRRAVLFLAKKIGTSTYGYDPTELIFSLLAEHADKQAANILLRTTFLFKNHLIDLIRIVKTKGIKSNEIASVLEEELGKTRDSSERITIIRGLISLKETQALRIVTDYISKIRQTISDKADLEARKNLLIGDINRLIKESRIEDLQKALAKIPMATWTQKQQGQGIDAGCTWEEEHKAPLAEFAKEYVRLENEIGEISGKLYLLYKKVGNTDALLKKIEILEDELRQIDSLFRGAASPGEVSPAAPAVAEAPAVPAAPVAPAASPSLWQKAGRALGKIFKGKVPLFLALSVLIVFGIGYAMELMEVGETLSYLDVDFAAVSIIGTIS